jgi:hypothetical protein
MLYSLPSGKVIQITIEQYLEMTDEDVQYLMSIDYGETVISPFFGSAITQKKQKQASEDHEYDKSIDFVSDDEDKSHGDNFFIEEVSLDDIPDIPDESTLD